MKILFIADGRSPIALNWIKYWGKQGYEVSLVSTYPAEVELPLAHLEVVPVAFSQTKAKKNTVTVKKKSPLWGAATLKLRLGLRHWLGPLTLPKAAARLNEIITELQPNIVHAMRVPYEGMLAGLAKSQATNFPPLLISIWGNDFTLHAPSSPLMKRYTRLALKQANALHADCERDIHLATKWHFDSSLPSIVLPGAGGIDRDIFYPPTRPTRAPSVINPRGFRGYVRNDTFFKAIPLVLKEQPETKFICPTMAGEAQAEAWVQALGIQESVTLTPALKREQLADKFRSVQILVSPSTHDGTPNSLIEGMSCGCFPICGDLASIREWIVDGENGYLIDPSKPEELAEAILKALNNERLREQARRKNQEIIASRAEYEHSMAQAESFYKKILA